MGKGCNSGGRSRKDRATITRASMAQTRASMAHRGGRKAAATRGPRSDEEALRIVVDGWGIGVYITGALEERTLHPAPMEAVPEKVEHSTCEWEGRDVPREAQGPNPTYSRPEGTRVCPKTLGYQSKSGVRGRGSEWVYDKQDRTVYFHSGVNRAPYLKWVAEERKRVGVEMGAMVNAESAAQPALLEAYVQYPDVPLVIDSGAYQQSERSVQDYVEVLETIDTYLARSGEGGLLRRFEWVANLDVIGGLGSGRHFFRLREHGIEPLWIAHARVSTGQNGIDVDISAPPEEAFELREGMTIGVGGLVPIIQEAGREVVREVIRGVGETLQRRGLKGHFFGLGIPCLLKQFGSKPWMESADSSKWLAGQKGRKLYRDDGSYIRADRQGLCLTRQECARQNLRQIGEWFGGEPSNGEADQVRLFGEKEHPR